MAGVDSAGQDKVFIGRFLAKNSGKFLPGAIEVPEASYSFGPMTVFDDSGIFSFQPFILKIFFRKSYNRDRFLAKKIIL